MKKEKVHVKKQNFPEVKIRRQILHHYPLGISNHTSFYGMFNFELSPSQTNQKPHRIQTEDIDLDFSKIFTEYI